MPNGPMSLPNINKNISKPHTQEFGFEFHSMEVTEKQP